MVSEKDTQRGCGGECRVESAFHVRRNPTKEQTMKKILSKALTAIIGTGEVVAHNPEALHIGAAVRRALIVIRESNRYDLLAFATMVLQTLDPLMHLPGVAAYLIAAGDDPALIMRAGPQGDRIRRLLGAHPLYQGNRAYGWTCEIEGSIFVFAMTSAMTSVDEDLSNPFTTDLIALIRQERPSHLFAGPESRLVRRASLGAILGDACERLGVIVHTRIYYQGIDIKTNGLLWSILCRQCEEDLKTTVSRLLTGRIYKVRRNEWDRGEGSVLAGYALDVDDRILLGTNQQQGVARLAIELAAQAHAQRTDGASTGDVELTPECIVAQLAAAGAVKRSNKKVNRFGNAIAGAPMDTANARQSLLGILRDIPAYWTGTLIRRQGLPITGLTSRDIHGLPVYRVTDDGEEKGFTIFQWTLPLPDGGWATDATFEKAWQYFEWLRDSDARQTRETDQESWPLSGLFTAIQGDQSFRLTHGSAGYQWRQYPATKGYSKGVSRAIGKFANKEVIIRLVAAIVAKLELEGLSAEELSAGWVTGAPASPDSLDTEREQLQRDEADLQKEYDNVCALAQSASNERARDRWGNEVDRLGVKLDEIALKIAECAVSAAPVGPPPQIELGSLATLLSILIDTAGDPVDPVVANALAKLVTQGTVVGCWDDDAPWAEFVFHLRLKTSAGWRIVGPVSFELGNSSQGSDRQAWHRRMVRVAELRMAGGMSIEELAPRLGQEPSARRLFGSITQTVAEIFDVELNVAAAMVDHPIDSTRAALWVAKHGGTMPKFAGLTKAQSLRHVEVLKERYLTVGVVHHVPAAFLGGERSRREVARWVRAHSMSDPDAGAPILELAAVMGWAIPRDAASHLTKRTTERGLTPQAALLEKWTADGQADWGTGSKWVIDPATGKGKQVVAIPDEDKRLRVRKCEWCATRTILQAIPCLEGGADPVLCTTCRRTPEDPTHVLPMDYLKNWEGPYGRTITNDRGSISRGARAGTRLGPQTALPSKSRLRNLTPNGVRRGGRPKGLPAAV
jgi:hypothetical protein